MRQVTQGGADAQIPRTDSDRLILVGGGDLDVPTANAVRSHVALSARRGPAGPRLLASAPRQPRRAAVRNRRSGVAKRQPVRRSP
jgi:hypothetical protein